MPSISEIIAQAAARQGIDPAHFARVAGIESGMNPNARTGSYQGLFQLSPSEFKRYGGNNIYDPAQNAQSAAAMMADQRNAFTAKYGRPPTPTEAYMIHQQGAAGLDAHLANPDAPAWQNMASTGEGRQKGAAWAKQAIWGNIPDQLKAQFGNVNNVTSDAFINQIWRPKVEGDSQAATGSPPGMPTQAGDTPLPAGGFPTAMAAGLPSGAQNAPNGLSGAQGANPFASLGQAGQQMMQSPPITPMPWMQLPMASRPQLDLSKLQAIATNPALRPLG